MTKRFTILFLLLMPLLAVCQQDTGAVMTYGKVPGKGANSFRKARKQEARRMTRLEDAQALYQKGKYGPAVKKFTQVLEWAKEFDNREIAAKALEGLGLTYSAFQKLPESISSLRQALAINNGLKDQESIIRVSAILSDVYYSKSSFDSALHFAGLSLDAGADEEITVDLQSARLSRIAVLMRIKSWQEADRATLHLPKAFIDPLHPDLLVRYQALTGAYFFARGRLEASQRYYDSALQIARAQHSSALFAIAYGHMIDAYADKGDYKSGFECLRKYNEAVNQLYAGTQAGGFQPNLYKNNIYSLSIEKKLNRLQLLQAAAENKAKEERLKHGAADLSALQRKNLLKDSLLKLQDSLMQQVNLLNKAQQSELNIRKTLDALNRLQHTHTLKDRDEKLRSLMIGLGVALMLGGIIFYQYKRQKRKNAIINRQNEELQTLMREIHHRVKNNLQVISSLLDLQSQTITDIQAAAAIKEGKNRVLSMALIHQNLYGDGNIQRIKVKEYIQSLSAGLMSSYNIAPERIKVHTDIDDLDLDVDTVIPLGLILNELISNALKHAFKSAQQGEIRIVLKEEGNTLVLKVKDNGPGFADGAVSAHSTSFGMKLIKAFSIKLKAKLDMYNDNGAAVTMHIHKYKPV